MSAAIQDLGINVKETANKYGGGWLLFLNC